MAFKIDKFADNQDFQLPEFPALHRCLLCEARHGSRLDIAKDIRASNMFENVIEAKSLSDALGLLKMEKFDALYLGPSITPEAGAKFIRKGKAESRAEDCAFIALLNRLSIENKEEEVATLLLDSGVHGVIIRPCLKSVLAEGTVRALVKANANCPWAGIMLNALADDPDMLAEFGLVSMELERERAQAFRQKLIIRSVFETAAENLKDIAEGTELGRYGLDTKGAPTKKTQEAIHTLCEQVMENLTAESEEGAFSGFKEFFEQSVIEWITDYINIDANTAAKNLQEKLVEFVSR